MVEIEAATKARVLVVDDLSLMRLYYKSTLEKAGFEIEPAMNGIEAMERILAKSSVLVIVDVNMPRVDGSTFLRALRRGRNDLSGLPALVVSTEAEMIDIAEARASGA